MWDFAGEIEQRRNQSSGDKILILTLLDLRNQNHQPKDERTRGVKIALAQSYGDGGKKKERKKY